MLIIWLQGIWLPLHGFSFESTPLWAGIYLLPMTAGFLVAAPARGLAVRPLRCASVHRWRMLLMAATFVALLIIPVNFDYWVFAVLVFLNGLGGGIFTAPNTAAIMSSVPAAERGAASGVRATFFNAGSSLSIGVFFSLMIVGLAHTLPFGDEQRAAGAQGVSATSPAMWPTCLLSAACSPRSSATTRSPNCWPPRVRCKTPGVNVEVLTGKTFFPQLITEPFHSGLAVVFVAAAVMMLIGAVASMFNPGRYGDADTEA